MFLLYDATFEGLLSALALCLREQRAVMGIFPEGRAQQCLMVPEPVASEPDILARFDRYLSRRFGDGVLDLLFHAYLSETDDIEMRILGFLRTGLRIGTDPSGMLQDPDVAAVREAARTVSRQAHAYLGLLRFKRIAGVYVADFEPDYHVLPLVAPHFADRMRDTPFLIRDRRRALASVGYPGKPWFIVALDADDMNGADGSPSGLELPDSLAGEVMEETWRAYFSVMAIPERIKPELQRSNMPKKYWKYLVERPGAGGSHGLRYNGR